MWFQDAPFEGVVDNFSAGAARSSACARPSLNTVQLGRCDRIGWYLLGLRPVGVVGALDVPFDVLAFDDAGR